MAWNYLFFVLSTFFVILIANAHGLDSENIIGGTPADINSNNFMVSIHTKSYQICGGALIDADVVLTAAHCFDTNGTRYIPFEYRNNTFFVVAGTKDAADFTHRIRVDKIYLHAQYSKNRSIFNDIAILKLKEKFDVVNYSNIGVARLPKIDEDYEGKVGRVLGFGADAVRYSKSKKIWKPSRYLETLQQATVQIVDPKKCKVHKYQDFLCGMTIPLEGQGVACAVGVCKGDSGGPLMLNDTVIGIVSTSQLNYDNRFEPATYIKVSKYLNFIENAIRGYESIDTVVIPVKSRKRKI
ncbi:venom peptide isomerase heavy chain-like [Copidosoma floridanum]|uniref:venom peptide isomerase heavy chain-like n=1 Tax=Copidosoma floridanum TaxID=29053 RepID=UPI0006C9A6C5|nr:venom peptide isomerase heavy chain-like [Copidosoma floridanum]